MDSAPFFSTFWGRLPIPLNSTNPKKSDADPFLPVEIQWASECFCGCISPSFPTDGCHYVVSFPSKKVRRGSDG